jgi:hypothetical protein
MEWAETSGNKIYIEFPEVKSFVNTAGSFHIEQFDPCGIKQTAVIRLYLPTIDQATVGPSNKRDNGLIPFAGLGREERYAEVLGHELAHTVDILGSLERTLMVEELVEQTNEQFFSFRSSSPGWPLPGKLVKLINKRNALLTQLEQVADSYEMTIWRELMRN